MANDDLQRFIDELHSRVSIVDVVGAKVKLTKKGREHQGLCPFHNEKTPSFTVNESKGFYHCFGCGAHGDIVKFEMEANGLPFIDALQKLSHMAGLQMPKFSSRDKEENETRKSLYDIMEQACTFFERSLLMPEGREGLKYFTEKRGLTKEIIQKFRLGYAPNNNALMALLKSAGVEEKDMKDLGLIAIPEDKSRRPHDFFRNRVMIPITNKQGKIIAFGGRVMEKIEPKYLNSPETPIFNKRRNLYNLDKAREIAYQTKKLIICEGYMDVIALDRYGFGYAVAPLGTALTEEQIAEAWKVCPEPILCLDGDSPGVKAAMRAVDRVIPILKAGYSLKFLFLPNNMDPDEYLQAHGHDSFASLLTKTKPLIDILWQKYTENEDSSTPERKALIEKTLLAEVSKIGDPTVRSYYAQEIRNRIYKAFKQTAWSNQPYPTRKSYTPASHPTPRPAPAQQTPQPTISTPPAYLDDIPLPNTSSIPSAIPDGYTSYEPDYAPQPTNTPRQQPNNTYQRTNQRNNNWQNKPKRPTIKHNISSTNPDVLRQTAENEQDKNIRLIIAGQLLYPELIDDFEEKIYTDNIKNSGLKQLYTLMSDTYHETDTPISSEELEQALLQSSVSSTLKSLWELDMLKKQSPFINDLRKNIEKLLLEDKLRSLEDEIKKLSANLCKNFSEEDYLRQQELKKERDEILSNAAEPDDE